MRRDERFADDFVEITPAHDSLSLSTISGWAVVDASTGRTVAVFLYGADADAMADAAPGRDLIVAPCRAEVITWMGVDDDHGRLVRAAAALRHGVPDREVIGRGAADEAIHLRTVERA